MAKKYEQPTEGTPGDTVKNAVDSTMSSGLRTLWKGVQEVGAGSFFKGTAIAGLLIIGAMALVSGSFGAAGTLVANSSLVTTFEGGMGAGISAALKFLGSGLGLATMAAGGIMATGSDIIKNQQKQAALESERLALEYQRSREPQKEVNITETQNTTSIKQETHEKTTEAAPNRESSSIYVKGSIIKNNKFCAAELKRRTDRELRITEVG